MQMAFSKIMEKVDNENKNRELRIVYPFQEGLPVIRA